MKKEQIIALALGITILSIIPSSAENAVQLLTPFGGKVEEYDPAPEACVMKITLPVAVKTGVVITIEKVKVGKPMGGTFGVARINLIPVMPPPTNIKKYYAYAMPGTWVLGNSINLCNVCQQIESTGEKIGADFAKDFCESIPGIGELLKVICEISGDCPVNNLIYQIGTGSPIGGIIENIKKNICKKIFDAIPLIGTYLSGAVCDNL